MQGKALAHDLEQSSIVDETLACEVEIDALQRYVKGKKFRKTRVKHLNADNDADVARTIEQSGAQIFISMLPVQF